MKYCRITTTNHPVVKKYPHCLEDINVLIVREGYKEPNPLFTNKEVVINMDWAETANAEKEKRDEKNKSMDMAFGIKNSTSTKIRMLLVELKFNILAVYGLNKVYLEGKIAGSSRILGNNPLISKLYIIIVDTKHVQEAISRLFRMNPKIPENFTAMDIHDLKQTFF